MKTATIARPVALAAGSALVAGFLLASPAQAADRDFVLTHGHVDGFEITYDPAENELVTQIKDDTRIYDATPQFRDPTQVTLAYQDEQAIGTLPAATGSWSFLGAHGGTEAWLASQSGGDQGYVPWVGWSTERLLNTLSGSGITPASGQPVSIDLDIDGPGDVFTFQNDSFGLPINRFVDTTNADPDRIRVTENAHVHTNWIFTAEGDYSVDATPSLATVEHGTITGPTVSYHFRVGAAGTDPGPGPTDPIETTLTIEGMADHYHSGDMVTLTAVQDPPTGEDHYHWFTRTSASDDWSVVAGALTDTLQLTAEAALNGRQIIARLYDHDHNVIAESAPVTLHVNDHEPGPDPEPGTATQDIIATLPASAGALVISVDPDDRTVLMPDFELAADGASWHTSGGLRPVTVTDTRAGAPGWTASGQVSDFASTAGDIAGSHLGWSPKVLSQADGQGVTAGSPVAPGFPTGDGLSVSQTLGGAASGTGTGTAQLGADLELRVPTTTAPGTYQATITFTAL